MTHILVVDDNDQLRLILCELLTSYGFEVSEANNGNEALYKLQTEIINLVLIDIIMPDKEGIETIPEIRSKYPLLKIIAMSGGGRHLRAINYLKAAKELGAQATLEKPFRAVDLLNIIQDIL